MARRGPVPVSLQLDLLAKMSEDWTDTTSAMLSMCIAMVMLSFNSRDLELDLSKTKEIMDKFEIDRTYYIIDGGLKLRVTLKEREKTGQGEASDVPDNDAPQAGPAAGDTRANEGES